MGADGNTTTETNEDVMYCYHKKLKDRSPIYREIQIPHETFNTVLLTVTINMYELMLLWN